jgi:hypothetical protein
MVRWVGMPRAWVGRTRSSARFDGRALEDAAAAHISGVQFAFGRPTRESFYPGQARPGFGRPTHTGRRPEVSTGNGRWGRGCSGQQTLVLITVISWCCAVGEKTRRAPWSRPVRRRIKRLTSTPKSKSLVKYLLCLGGSVSCFRSIPLSLAINQSVLVLPALRCVALPNIPFPTIQSPLGASTKRGSRSVGPSGSLVRLSLASAPPPRTVAGGLLVFHAPAATVQSSTASIDPSQEPAAALKPLCHYCLMPRAPGALVRHEKPKAWQATQSCISC